METVIVLLILCLAAAAGVWTFYKTIKGKSGCSCSENCNVCSKTERNDNG